MTRVTTILMVMVVMATSRSEGADALRWAAVDLPGCGVTVTAIAPSPHQTQTVLVGTASAGIRYSEDGGDRWHVATGLTCLAINSVTWHPTAPQVAWAGTMNGVYMSRDGGKSWELRSAGMPTDSIIENCTYPCPVTKIMFDPRDAAHLVAFNGVLNPALVSQAKVGGVWESRDGGGIWRNVSVIGSEKPTASVTDDGAAAASGISIVDAAFPGRIPMLMVAVSNGGGFYESVDGGETWKNKSKGLPHRHAARLVTLPGRMDTFIVALGKSVPEFGDTKVHPGGIFKTISGGEGWFTLSKDLPRMKHAREHHVTGYSAYCMSPSQPNIMYACDGSFASGIIFKSADGGRSWAPLATQRHFGQEPSDAAKALYQVETFIAVGLSHLSVMATDSKTPNTVYAGGMNLLIRSKDGGKSWQDLSAKKTATGTWGGTGLGAIDVTDIGFDADTDGRVVVTGRGAAKILESLDGGKTWALHGNDAFPWGGGNAVAFAKRRAYVGTGEYGVFGSIVTALGSNWKTVIDESSGLPPIKQCGQVSDLHVDETRFNVVNAIIGGAVYSSSNFGRSWRKLYNRRDLAHLAGVPKRPETFYVSGSRSCYVHTGAGKFSPIGGPQDAGRLTCDARGRLYLASPNSARPGVWRFQGKAWERLLDETYVVDVAIDPKNPNRLAVCTNDRGINPSVNASGIWLSNDGGKRWTVANEGLPMLPGDALAFDPRTPDTLWFGTSGGGIYALSWPASETLSGDHLYASTEEDRKYAVYRPGKRPGGLPGGNDGARNPLRNGNMEQGTTQVTFWNSRWTGRGRIIVARDTTTARDGEASLRIQSVGGQAKGQIAQVMLAGNVKQVTVVAYVKSSGKVGAQVSLQAFDAGWKTLKYHTIKHFRKVDKWMKIEGTVVLPPGTARFGLGLLIEGDGKAWIDGVQMKVK